jgi:hypothetical protein
MHVQPVFTSHASFLNHIIPRLLQYNILTASIKMPGKQLVVFDFDWSFVDQDTDRFVLEVLSTKLRRKLQTIKSGGSQCTPDVV